MDMVMLLLQRQSAPQPLIHLGQIRWRQRADVMKDTGRVEGKKDRFTG
jgi:hypothetical protein